MKRRDLLGMKLKVNKDNTSAQPEIIIRKKNLWSKFKEQAILQVIALIGILYLILFHYIPMVGIIIAFKNFRLASGLAGFFTSKWVGLKWFHEFVTDIVFWPIVRNTLVLSFAKLIFTFPMPIIFALVLNEVRGQKLKKITQTVSYLPHFISWIVVSGMIFSFANEQNGIINQLFGLFGLKHISILSDPKYFVSMCVISGVWKEMGWWTIIFLAAIVGIDPTLYEAAVVDGAGRLRRMWDITLPSIKGTIIVVLILSLGDLLGGGLGGSNFDQAYLLGNNVNYNVSEILQTYTLKMGLSQGRFSYATAIGLIQSIVSLILVYSSNLFAKKASGTGLF